MTDTIALALVAAELSEPIDALAQRLGAEVMLGPAGVRYIDVKVAAELVDAHHVRRQTERERQQAATERLRKLNPAQELRRRVRAIKEQQVEANIQVADLDLASAAFAIGTRDHHAARQRASGRVLGEMLANSRGDSMKVHSLNRAGEERN